jgi:hypothetical protein
MYKWSDVAILSDFFVAHSHQLVRMQSKTLEQVFTGAGLRPTLIESESEDFHDALREVAKVSRGKVCYETKSNINNILCLRFPLYSIALV